MNIVPKAWKDRIKANFETAYVASKNTLFYKLRQIWSKPGWSGNAVHSMDQIMLRHKGAGWLRACEVWRVASGGKNVGPKSKTICDEIMLARSCGYNPRPMVGTNYVFGNRLQRDIKNPVKEIGEFRHNQNTWAIYVSSYPRSPAGEYCGFPVFTRFSHRTFDRSVDQPYATMFKLTRNTHCDRTSYGDPLYVFDFWQSNRHYGIFLDSHTESGFRCEQMK